MFIIKFISCNIHPIWAYDYIPSKPISVHSFLPLSISKFKQATICGLWVWKSSLCLSVVKEGNLITAPWRSLSALNFLGNIFTPCMARLQVLNLFWRRVGTRYFSKWVLQNNLPRNLSSFFPPLCMFGCEFLYLLPSAARWNLSDDDWTRYQSVTIAEYHFIDYFSLFVNGVWFCPRSRSHPVSGSWTSRHCRAQAPSCGMALN